MTKKIIGVMGPGNPLKSTAETAEKLGYLIAEQGWILLTGGRNKGVMDAASRGAKKSGGLTIGILPGTDKSELSDYIDIPIITGLGSARNNINVLSSDVVIACGMGPGTMSEIFLAIKANKHVILLNQTDASKIFFKEFQSDKIHFTSSPPQAIKAALDIITNSS